ncbi:MAG: sugar phosphate isomerase/epimerase [Bacteroidales bacterium]|nr:sugar phosphate isomerase/epimerase [Bacteroidales bacterium]
MQRRSFLKTSSIALVGSAGIHPAKAEVYHPACYGPTPSLNAYSFNEALLKGGMSLNSLFQFVAQTGFSAVDLTAYYIPGYPEVPGDQLLYEIKRKAFRTGISFSGTGVRNDFTVADQELLAGEIDHVKQWIIAASKLGAPNIRVFDGKAQSAGKSVDDTQKQVANAFRECARFGSRYGVTVAFQNHNDFLVSADEIIDIIRRVDSEWFGLMLDTGSVAGPDPYSEIEKLIPYALTWQVKEKVQTGIGTSPVDMKRLMELIHKHQYHGFLPIETLGEGDPREKVRVLYQKVADNL